MKTDVYTKITDQIIAELEKGVRPWHKALGGGACRRTVSRPLRSNGKPYSGINVIMLWATAMEQRAMPRRSGWTFKQAKRAGGACAPRARKATLVGLFQHLHNRPRRTRTARKWSGIFRSLKGYTVFNIEPDRRGSGALYRHGPCAAPQSRAKRNRTGGEVLGRDGCRYPARGRPGFFMPPST